MVAEFEPKTTGERAYFSEGWYDRRTIPIDPKWEAVSTLPRLVVLSRQAVHKVSHSYRGFKVGLAMLALDTRGQRSGVYTSGNFTPLPAAEDGTPWGCSERFGRDKLHLLGFDKILSMAIAGPLKPDEKRPLITPTLHPCYRCRNMFITDSMFSDDTLVATTTLDESELELHTVRGLIDLYHTGIKPDFPSDYHPFLSKMWEDLVSYDPEDERQEIEFLKRIGRMQGIR